MTEQLRRIAVWSGWLRIAHWSLAGATLLLLATGWLIAHAPTLADSAAEVHYLGAGVLVFALALRGFLGVFGKASERFEHLLPRASEWTGIRGSLLFYLSLGRSPLPNWFAHNPFWKPLYLVLFAALVLSVLTGWLMLDISVVGRLYLPRLHAVSADFIGVLVLAHLYSVVMQDLRGQGADISAMVNGHRLFRIERDAGLPPEIPQVAIRLDEVGGREASERQR